MNSLLVDWILTALSFFYLQLICAANMSTAQTFFFTVNTRCEDVQMVQSNQSKTRERKKKPLQREQPFSL